VIGTSIAAILFASSLSLLSNPSSETLPTPVLAGISYTSHVAISINGNPQFNNTNYPLNGVVSGNGTADNPYIIEGWDINASSSDGIFIQNTNAYFLVRNCYVHDGGLSHEGIYLSNCVHGTVTENICSNNYDDLRLDSSSDNIINNNTFRNNDQFDHYGICLSGSSKNILSGNNCSDNDFGIYLWYSDSNILRNNSCHSNNRTGIYLDSSSDSNNLNNNTCSSNGDDGIDLFGVGLTSSINNILSNNTCNSNNDDGIYIDSSKGNNNLNNNACISNSGDGIGLHSSIGNILSNNNCSSNNRTGIYLDSSSDNTLFWNEVHNNTLQGVLINSGTLNRIWNNTFINNNGAGIVYDLNHVQACDNGTNNKWSSSISGNYWSDWTTPDNSPPWWIVDNPYNISGSAGAKDYLPLSSHPENIAPITTASLAGTSGANGWFTSTVSVSFSATDEGSGVGATYYRIGTSGSWHSYSSSIPISAEGNTTVQFYSRDNAGNSESTGSITFKMDKTSPAGTIVIQGGTIFATATAVTLNITASDNISGVEQFRCSNDGVTWGSWESWQNLSDSMSWNLQIGDGLKIVFFQIMDNASNVVTCNDTIILDTTPPSMSFGIESGLNFTGSSATINWSATDTNGIVSYEYSLDSASFVSCGLATHIDLNNLTVGSHNLTIRAIDGAGEVAEKKLQFNVIATEPSSGLFIDELIPWLLLITAIVAVVLLLFLLLRRKKGKKTTAEESESSAQPPQPE
jgi:parallel beta-helix repeat protein